MKVLITGGAGFIGSNFLKYMVKKYPHYKLVHVDALTYAGNLENLQELESHPQYRFVKGDITDTVLVESLFAEGIDTVVNFAAESHVDRSIANPGIFVETNVVGTHVLLAAAVKYGVGKFVQISTDEVYGTLGKTGLFTEQTPLAPNSPYSASKAGADHLVRAYHETYQLPVNITRCSNNYGPYQFPEKLIPLMITQALQDKPLPIYGDGQNVRDWLHVDDHCSAIDLIMHKGVDGEVYNVGGNNERTNVEVVNAILDILKKPQSLMKYVEDRKGHDRRYAIDASKIKAELGWQPQYDFDTGLQQTISWYLSHTDWTKKVISGEYKEYYHKQYRSRLGDSL